MTSTVDIAQLYREGFQLIRDISGGIYSGERGTTAMSAEVLNPVSEALAALDATDDASVMAAKRSLKQLCETEHKVMSNYPTIMRFSFEDSIPSTASN